MDFAAWMEVYLGDRWWTFDPRNNERRKGRVLIGRGRDADRPTLLGSAKTNFGHMESAAGAAGLAKIVLGMQHDAVPPTINYAGPNPYIDFDAARLSVVTETTPWPRYSGRAVAGILIDRVDLPVGGSEHRAAVEGQRGEVAEGQLQQVGQVLIGTFLPARGPNEVEAFS